MTKLYECPKCNTSQLSEEKLKEHCLQIHGRTLKALLSMKCDACHEPMHQIGPFAERVREGQPIPKWDGLTEYECVNDQCTNYQTKIKK